MPAKKESRVLTEKWTWYPVTKEENLSTSANVDRAITQARLQVSQY